MAKVFFSYSHKDEELRDRLEVALKMLQRQGMIETWHDRRIVAGSELYQDISRNLEEADVILLLISPDFLASDYCYDREMGRAMERHRAGEAKVIPIILRHCDWHSAPFGKLMATPPDGKPIRSFADLDEAFQAVATAIRAAIGVTPGSQTGASSRPVTASAPMRPAAGPRSSNLALPKSFTDRDKDNFLEESYEYVRAYFENSLDELKARNPGIDTGFRKISENQFNATLYQNGKEIARCWITLGEVMGRGIAYSNNGNSNGFNEQLRVESDAQGLFLKGSGMVSYGTGRDEKLTQEGGAERLWGMLIHPLQSRVR